MASIASEPIASAFKRLINNCIDGFLVLFPAGWIIIIFPKGGILSLFLGLILYYVFFESIWQRTPAKFLTKTKVVMVDGSKPDFKHILGRTLARLIPFDHLSFLSSHPVGWHDEFSGTLVVFSPPQPTNKEGHKKTGLRQEISPAVIFLILFTLVLVFYGLELIFAD